MLKKTKQHSSENLPFWKKKLAERGIGEKVIDYFEIEPTEDGKGWRYPCQYPSGEVIYRVKRFPGQFPKYLSPATEELVYGELPPFYHPHIDYLRDSIENEHGILYGVEGEPDLWTAVGAFEQENWIAFVGAGTISKDLYHTLKKFGVRHFIYYTDLDFDGMEVCQHLFDIFNGTDITFSPRRYPESVNSKFIKDTNDLWLALEMDRSAMISYRDNAPSVPVLTKEQRRALKDEEYGISPDLNTEIEKRLNIDPDNDYKPDDWTKNIPCIFVSHTHDKNKPGFGWNRRYRYAKCFKCGKTWGIRAVAQQLSIDIKKYETKSSTSISSTLGLQPSTALAAARASHGNKVDYLSLDPQSFLYTTDDIIENYLKSLSGEFVPDNPPLPFPFSSPLLDDMGGNAVVIEPGTLWLMIGKSGGYKCISHDTRIQTEHGLVKIGHYANGIKDFSELGIAVQSPSGVKIATHFYDSGISPTKRIKTCFGFDLQATHNHPILVLDNNGLPVWMRMDELRQGMVVAIYRGAGSMFGKNVSLLPFGNIDRKMDLETAYSFGVLTSTGVISKASDHFSLVTANESVVNRVKKWVEEFGLALHRHKYLPKHTLFSKEFTAWISSVGVRIKSNERDVPECIYTAPELYIKEFIRGLFDSAAEIRKSDFSIFYSTTSPLLAKGIQQLLLLFGIVSDRIFVKSYDSGIWRITISGNEAKRYLDKIGFHDLKKMNLASAVIENFSSVDSASLDESDYFFDTIFSVENAEAVQTFDVTIPDGHAFISGGFVSHNTSVLTTVMSKWQHDGYHGLVVSPEWGVGNEDSDSFIARQVQQLGGITMSEKLLLKRFYYEQKHGVNSKGKNFGRLPAEIDLNLSKYYADNVIRSWEGKVGFVNKFGADALEFLGMVEAAYHYMAADSYQDRQTGEVKPKKPLKPSWIIFDYLQLFFNPAGDKTWDTNKTINHIKALCLRLNVVGIVATQITKSSTKELATNKSFTITEADAVNTRIDAFNLVSAIKVTDNVDQNGNIQAYLDIIKNSTGKKGTMEMEINGRTTNVLEVVVVNEDFGNPNASYKTVGDQKSIPTNSENDKQQKDYMASIPFDTDESPIDNSSEFIYDDEDVDIDDSLIPFN